MPPRSNLFQTLVFLIQQHLSGPTAVTESAMLQDRTTGTLREVDVVVEGTVAGRRVLISFECRAHQRKQAVGWIEEAHAKHSRLPTNVLVLVSSSGFTAEAARVARSYGIELVTPGIADESAATNIVGRLESLWYKEMSLTATGAEVCADQNDAIAGYRPGLEIADESVYDSSGAAQGTLQHLATEIVRRVDFGKLGRDAVGGEESFEIEVEDPTFDGTDGESVGPIFVMDSSDDPPSMRAIRKLTVTGDAHVVVAEIPLTHGQLAGTPYAFGQTDAGERKLLLVVTEPEGGSRQITVKFTPRKP